MASAKTTKLTFAVIRLFVAATAVKAVLSIYRIITTTAPDFVYYYEAAGEVIRRVVDPIHLLPPASLLIYAPIQLFPYAIAQGIWVTVSFLCLIAVVWMLTAMAGIRNPWIRGTVGALAYLSFPTQFTLGMGQVNLIVLFLFVVSVVMETKHRSVFAGSIFALAILLKPELILLVPVFVFTRRWRYLGSLTVFLAGCVGISMLVFGGDAYTLYAARMSSALGEWRDMGIYYNQGLSGLAARLGLGGSNWYIGLSVLVGLVTLYVIRKRHIAFPLVLWLALPVFLLVEPIAWQHHFVFLLPVYVLFWNRMPTLRARILLGMSFFLVSMNFASPGFLDTMPLGWLVSSHVTVGTLLLWIVALRYI